MKDEGIDSSSDDESSASSVSSSEKSCSSSESSDELPDPKPRRFQRKNSKLKNCRTESDIPRHDARKIQLPGAHELKERLNQAKNLDVQIRNPEVFKMEVPGSNESKERPVQAKNVDVKIPLLGKLGRKPSEDIKEDDKARYRRFVKKLDEPIQLGKLRRPPEKVNQVPEIPPPVMKISALNQAAKNKFFGLEPVKKEKNIDELTAAVRKYISPVSLFQYTGYVISSSFLT